MVEPNQRVIGSPKGYISSTQLIRHKVTPMLSKRMPYQYRHSRLRGKSKRKGGQLAMVGDEGGWQIVGRRRIDNITTLFIESIQMSRVKGALKDHTHRINSDE